MSTPPKTSPQEEPLSTDAPVSVGSGSEDPKTLTQEEPLLTPRASSMSPKIPPQEEVVAKKSPLGKIVVLAVVCVLVLGVSIWGLVSALGSEDQTASYQEQSSSGVEATQSSSGTANAATDAGEANADSSSEDSNSSQESSQALSATTTTTTAGNSDQSAQEAAAQVVNVSLNISCYDAVSAGNATALAVSNNGAMWSSSLRLDTGSTVYDALARCGAVVGSSTSATGVYVYSIGGLAQYDAGADSGWHYYVNGSEPNYTCSNYVLKDGDSVEWRYELQI